MSAVAINRKIARGFAKVGKKLGYPAHIYRPDSYITPVADRNRIITVPVTWSKDESFKTNPEPTLDYFTLYCDYTLIQVGDIIDMPTEGRTFSVSEITPIRGAVGVQCNQRMNVLRPVYNVSADIKTTLGDIVRDMPCAFQHKGAASNDGALSTVGSSMTAGQSQIEVWAVVTPSTIRLADVLEIDGVRYVITSVDASSSGIKISAKSTKAGK